MNHGQITVTGRTAEMTVSEYRQAVCVKYARLPRIGAENAVAVIDLAIAQGGDLGAALTRGRADRDRIASYVSRIGA
jgi:hypothetical protein